MTNQSLLDKAKEQHQARSERVVNALMAAGGGDTGAATGHLIDALTELAAIWREEATAWMTPDDKGQLRRGAKSTAESLRDCATRLMGFVEGLKKHGLPGAELPKALASPFTSTPVSGATGATEGTLTAVLDPRGSYVTPEDGKGLMQRDLQAVHDGQMTVEQFRAKWPETVPTDQMVEFLKNRKGDADPKVSTDSPLPTKLPATPISASVANGSTAATAQTVRPSDDPAGDFLRDLGRNQSVLIRPEGIFMNSGGALDTSQWRGIDRPVVISGTPVGTLVRDPGDPSTWTVSTAPPPPAWTQLPAVEVKSLSDDPSAWELPSPDHTSPSQANLAGKCGLRWWLRYRRGAQERPGWSAVGGTAVHACIEAIELVEAADTGEGYFPRTDRTNANIRQLWTEQFGRAIAATQKENPDYPIETWSAAKSGKEDRTWWDLDGPEMVHRYLAWRANWTAQGWEIAHAKDGRPAVEIESLSTIKGVPKPVKLVIDQVWFHRQSGQLAIVDIKSGSTAQPDYFQLATYALALTGVLADEYVPYVGTAPKGAFWDARSGQLGPLVRLIERHPDEEVAMRLAAPARMDAAGLYIANVEGGYGGCNSCPLKRACPVGSRAGKGES